MSERKIVLITGASSGMGLSTALHLSAKGYRVFGGSRSEPTQAAFEWLYLDVTDLESIQKAVDVIAVKAGRLDVLVNNAGLGIIGPVEETSPDLINRVFRTNVFGILDVTRAVMPLLRKSDSGLIINISSIASEFGLPFRGIYSASKAALERITESMRLEFKGSTLQICSLQPGDVATGINQNRLVADISADSVYYTNFERINRQVNHEVADAARPEVIARKIEQIILTPRPRLHYVVGPFLQKMSRLLKRLLPDRSFEWMMTRFYKL